MYNFRKVDELPTTVRGSKTGPIIEELLSIDIDQWIEVSGFKNKKEIQNVAASLRSGKRSFVTRLKKEGLKIAVRIDSKNNVLYIKRYQIK